MSNIAWHNTNEAEGRELTVDERQSLCGAKKPAGAGSLTRLVQQTRLHMPPNTDTAKAIDYRLKSRVVLTRYAKTGNR